jgi:hypothetical protein
MTKKTFILIAITGCVSIATQFSSSAATIPAGTNLVVRTRDAISSHDRVGRTFTAQLDQDVAVKNNVVLKAGTKVLGKIEASRGSSRNSNPLTLNLTGVVSNGRTVPIKTVSGVQPASSAKTMGQVQVRHGVSVGSFNVPVGTKMQFQIAQPINL